jgi:hypothetical protein
MVIFITNIIIIITIINSKERNFFPPERPETVLRSLTPSNYGVRKDHPQRCYTFHQFPQVYINKLKALVPSERFH